MQLRLPMSLGSFSVLTLAVGIVLSYLIFWKPWSVWLAARSWRPVPCTIVSSQLAESPSADGGFTYRAEITYTYIFDGGEYRGDRYSFVRGYEGEAAVVARHPPGFETTCWVDPANPDESVVNRDFSPVYLIGLFPLLFTAAGASGIAWALRQGRRSPAAQREVSLQPLPSPVGIDIPADAEQSQVLEPKLSRVGKLIEAVLISCWIGLVVGTLVYKSWRAGKLEDNLTALLVPFVLIVLFVVPPVLVLFNARLELKLSRMVLAQGESALLQWTLQGKAERVRRLRIVLEGREESLYLRTRGSGVKVFAEIAVVNTAQSIEIAHGSAHVQVPEDARPSSETGFSKIVWTLKAACEIPGWPDSEDEYEIVVVPAWWHPPKAGHEEKDPLGLPGSPPVSRGGGAR